MCGANPLWGAPRIHGELLKLGIAISQAAVSKYMARHRKPPSQTWRAFLSPYVERVIGSIRRECLDHVIIFSEKHLRRVLQEYVRYSHDYRTHLGLAKDCPHPRRIEPPHLGEIRTEPMVGGLHHRYFRDAA
jgi:hypothetical protein